MADFQAITNFLLPGFASIVQSWIPGGTIKGVQYVVKNPTRMDKKAGSFTINTNTSEWKDYSSGEHGYLIQLYSLINKIDDYESGERLAKEYNISNNNTTPVVITSPSESKPDFFPIIPIPADAKPKPKKLYKDKIKKFYSYLDKNGNTILYTCRIEYENGSKNVLPLTYNSDGNGGTAWKFKSVPKPRPIYGLDELYKNPKAQVLIVEGEKSRDYAQEIFKNVKSIVPIAWIGGTNGIHYIDWKPLKNRKLIFWPDSDTQRDAGNKMLPFFEQPGPKSMIAIYEQVRNLITEARIIKPPTDKINGWDIADSGFDYKKAVDFIKKHLIRFEDIKIEQKKEFVENLPFQYLGYNSINGLINYYYLPIGTKKVTVLTAAGHTKMNMLSLASIQYFEIKYPSKSGANWTAAANDCIRQCESIGLYDTMRIRGRGAWFDHGRTVLHLGDKLVINNKVEKIDTFKSKFIYEAEIPTECDEAFLKEHISNVEGKKLIEICEMLSFDNYINSQLLAGWLVLAPICGALDWRPHVWLTGESETGKSWIQDNIIYPCLGKFVIDAASNTTEAGLRGLAGNDAIPIKFDEIEMETMADFQRVMSIIMLARQASSNKHSLIIKGTTSGGAKTYCIRSCFMFSSINPKLYQQADENRITLLKLIKRLDYENGNMFDIVQEKVFDLLTDEYCMKLRARSIKLIPVIRKSCEILCNVMAKKLKSKRHGDQIGTLLAGAYSLLSSKVITLNKANEFANKIDWEQECSIKNKTDHEKLLDIIIESTIRTDSGNETISIGNLLQKAATKESEAMEDFQVGAERQFALTVLKKYGISLLKNNVIAIAEKHKMLSKLLKGTPWEGGHKIVLSRITGASSRTVRFIFGRGQNAIVLPFKSVFPDGVVDKEVKEF